MNDLAFWQRVVYSFARAFLATFIVTVPGILASPNLDVGRAAVTAAIIGALTAAFRAIQFFFTDEKADLERERAAYGQAASDR